jgi:hypothetical protein
MAGDWRAGVARSVRADEGEKRRGTGDGRETIRCWVVGVGLKAEQGGVSRKSG